MRHLAEAVLNDYVEGLLDPGARDDAEAHLAACHACRAEVDSLRSLLGGMRALARGIRPPHDLFPAIEREIREAAIVPIARPWRRAAWRELRVPLAAAAAVLVVLTAAITAWIVGSRPSEPVAEAPAPVPLAPAGLGNVAADYERAIAELATTLEARRSQLDPATVRLVEENLRFIDQAIRESREALAADPGNEILRDLVVSGYEQKLDLLRRATGAVEL